MSVQAGVSVFRPVYFFHQINAVELAEVIIVVPPINQIIMQMRYKILISGVKEASALQIF